MVRVEGADRVWGRDGDRLESGKGGGRETENLTQRVYC